MTALIERNIILFFRNKRGVLSSMVAALIVIVLYVCFLGEGLIQNLSELGDVKDLVNLWTMSGFISVASITTTLSAMVIIIKDQESGCAQDFTCSPLTSWQITGGYLLSAYAVGVIMSVLSFCLAELFLFLNGAAFLSFTSILLTLGAIFLTSAASTAMLFFLACMFQSMQTFSAISNVINPLSGFLTGIYIPIGSLPAIVQTFIKLFPLSHGAALMRQAMLQDAMIPLQANVSSEYFKLFQDEMGITFAFDGTVLSPWIHVLVLLLTTVFFYGCSVYVLHRREQKVT